MDLPIHPKIVHIPLALSVVMPLLTSGLLLAWWKGWYPRRVWLVAAALQLVLVVGGFASMQSGEQDEERVESVVGHDAIHEHEEAAEAFVYVAAGVLVLGLGGAFVRKDSLALSLAALATAGSLVVLGLALRAGQLGGELVYVHGAANAFTEPAPVVPVAPIEHEDDD